MIAGSFAAGVQGPAVVAGSSFAILQSVGATATTVGAMKIGAIAGGATGATGVVAVKVTVMVLKKMFWRSCAATSS